MDELARLPEKRSDFNFHHKQGQTDAYITGGEDQFNTVYKKCLRFDISDQKSHTLGYLNEGRKDNESLVTENHLMVYGGNAQGQTLSSIERIKLTNQKDFELFTIKNQSWLK